MWSEVSPLVIAEPEANHKLVPSIVQARGGRDRR